MSFNRVGSLHEGVWRICFLLNIRRFKLLFTMSPYGLRRSALCQGHCTLLMCLPTGELALSDDSLSAIRLFICQMSLEWSIKFRKKAVYPPHLRKVSFVYKHSASVFLLLFIWCSMGPKVEHSTPAVFNWPDEFNKNREFLLWYWPLQPGNLKKHHKYKTSNVC